MPHTKRRWIEERSRDIYHRQAKALGYRSRATFKLIQIDRRFRLLKLGGRVLELGCSPGGWTQYASERIGPEGFIVAIDREGAKPPGVRNARFIKMDVLDPNIESSIGAVLPPGTADLVLSDLSPDMTGRYQVDHERQVSLAKRALELSKLFLRREGGLIVKVFEGGLSQGLESDANAVFNKVRKFRPAASRKRSSEFYLVCVGFTQSAHSPRKW